MQCCLALHKKYEITSASHVDVTFFKKGMNSKFPLNFYFKITNLKAKFLKWIIGKVREESETLYML